MANVIKNYNLDDPKTKEFLAKIGEIIVNLNFLENDIEFWIWETIRANRKTAGESQVVGKIITNKLNFTQKLKLLHSLTIEKYGESEEERFQEVYKKIENAGKLRNTIAHSLWFIEFGSSKDDLSTHRINERAAFKEGKGYDFSKGYKEEGLGDLDKYTEEILEAKLSLLKFFIAFDRITT